MNVSAIIVTRGDVDLKPILLSLPEEWETLTWDNGQGALFRRVLSSTQAKIVLGEPLPDLGVYGRYAAIEYASHDLIYVQDDDVIVSDPQAIVNEWDRVALRQEQDPAGPPPDSEWGQHVVCNMPQEFRHDFYREHALVGFGAVFHRDTPQKAFAKIGLDGQVSPFIEDDDWCELSVRAGNGQVATFPDAAFVRRTCDIPVTALSPTIFVDIPKENLPHAYGDDRMWRQPEHQAERSYMLEQVLKIKETP